MTNTYLAGTLVRVATWTGIPNAPTGGFRDAYGNFIDPTSVILKYRPGALASVIIIDYPSPPIIRDGQGLYHADLDTTGFPTDSWTYQWVGTGVGQAPADAVFNVRAAPF